MTKVDADRRDADPRYVEMVRQQRDALERECLARGEAIERLSRHAALRDEQYRVLVEALEKSKRTHVTCEDCWYSCPKSGECCNEHRKGDDCDCGADTWNVYVETVLAGLHRLQIEP